MRVCQDIVYTIDHTLTGRKLMIGSKERQLIVRFNEPHINSVIEFANTYQQRDIDEKSLTTHEAILCNNFKKAGFLTTSKQEVKGFNEFSKMGKKLFSIYPKSTGCLYGILNNRVGALVLFILYALLGYALFVNRAYFPTTIAYTEMSLVDILTTIFVFPMLFLMLHELGHILFARLMGVEVQEISIGTFFIYPLVLVQYKGINLNTQFQRIVVILGGIFMHGVLAYLGFLAKIHAINWLSIAVVDIWIMANISFALTNLSFFGMTDGYFLMTILLGQTDLRMRGYKYLNAKLTRKNTSLDRSYMIWGFVLCGLFLYSLINLAFQITYWTILFDVNTMLIMAVVMALIVFVSIRFLHRIKKAF